MAKWIMCLTLLVVCSCVGTTPDVAESNERQTEPTSADSGREARKLKIEYISTVRYATEVELELGPALYSSRSYRGGGLDWGFCQGEGWGYRADSEDYGSADVFEKQEEDLFSVPLRQKPEWLDPRARPKKPVFFDETDGVITTSDSANNSFQINLGREDNIRVGQCFEIWRNNNVYVGVVEVTSILSDSTSLCGAVILADGHSIVMGDTIKSRLYQNGRFYKVALHGDFKSPSEKYTKAELTKLLKAAGCTVVDKVQQGVDLVVTGSNLLADEWYRTARKTMRFPTLKEDDIRRYFNS